MFQIFPSTQTEQNLGHFNVTLDMMRNHEIYLEANTPTEATGV